LWGEESAKTRAKRVRLQAEIKKREAEKEALDAEIDDLEQRLRELSGEPMFILTG
jgi:cell division protein FtsB